MAYARERAIKLSSQLVHVQPQASGLSFKIELSLLSLVEDVFAFRRVVSGLVECCLGRALCADCLIAADTRGAGRSDRKIDRRTAGREACVQTSGGQIQSCGSGCFHKLLVEAFSELRCGCMPAKLDRFIACQLALLVLEQSR